MTTINLEKSLIKENKKIALPKELLLINQYDTFSDLAENDVLSRVGLNKTLKDGKIIKEAINFRIEETKKFNQERVFHISQIEGICKKYHLRFLRTRYYKGVIDNELPNRIYNFEIAYDVKCNYSNTSIVAPMNSFELEKKPKDPLMFYRINDEYFYLIHKWGNDLNIFRTLMPMFSNGWVCWLFPPLLLSLLFFISFKIGIAAVVGAAILSTIVQIFSHINTSDPLTFVKKNNWDSPYN